ncbi:hypothetical protein ES703_81883 [subsurface metagenome]
METGLHKYQIIYADPPWKYRQGKSMGTSFQGAADAQYACLNYKEICSLPIDKIANKQSILFLWVTFPIKTNVNNMGFFFGIGYYTKSNAEVCLLATRGDAHKLVKDNSISQMIMAPKTEHSRKPTIVRERIVQMLSDLPRIELFARQKIEGWDCWGNEVESSIDLLGIQEMV